MMTAAVLFAKLRDRQRRRPNRARTIPSHQAIPLLESLEDRTVPDAVHILTNQHTDFDITYSAVQGKLVLAENNKSVDPIAYYPADHVILEFLAGAKRIQTSDPRFSFTGAAPGDPIWVVPISPRNPALLQYGVSGERIDSGVLASYNETDPRINNVIPFPWIRLNVVAVRGPGQFSVWQTDDFGNPTVWVATAGNPNPNLFFTAPGGHVDYNWAFTAPGNYEIDYQATAYLPDSTPISSDVTTYYYQVDDTAPPSPAPSGGRALPHSESETVAPAALLAARSQTMAAPPAVLASPVLGASQPFNTPTQTTLVPLAGRSLSVPVANALSIGEERRDGWSSFESAGLGEIFVTTDLVSDTPVPKR